MEWKLQPRKVLQLWHEQIYWMSFVSENPYQSAASADTQINITLLYQVCIQDKSTYFCTQF